MVKKRDRAVKARQAGPMDQVVMICRDCGGQETEAIYQVVWRSEDHPENNTGQESFFMHLWKYKCKGCGCEDFVLPPVFQTMRMQMKAAKNPMKLVKPDSREDAKTAKKDSDHEGDERHEGAAVEDRATE
jgi:hypothetical protein